MEFEKIIENVGELVPCARDNVLLLAAENVLVVDGEGPNFDSLSDSKGDAVKESLTVFGKSTEADSRLENDIDFDASNRDREFVAVISVDAEARLRVIESLLITVLVDIGLRDLRDREADFASENERENV